MIVVPVKNFHAATHDACRRVTDPVDWMSDGVNQRLRYPLTYVVDRPLESAPLWGNVDPFEVYKDRLTWATAQLVYAKGMIEAMRSMVKEPSLQIALAIGDVGHVQFQYTEALEALVMEPYADTVWMDWGRVGFLMELLAAVGGTRVGRLWAMSFAVCVRNDLVEQADRVARCALQDPYAHFRRKPIEGDVERLIAELPILVEEGPIMGLSHPYVRRVASPIFSAHSHAREKRWSMARRAMERCESEDWREACGLWINKMERTK